MSNIIKNNLTHYKKLLDQYISFQDEVSLYEVEQMSKSLIQQKYSPEEIVNLHNLALTQLYPNIDKPFIHAMSFLLEAMTYYGVSHQEIQSLRDSQLEIKSEISVAASMQRSFLSTRIPKHNSLEIGVKSVPASQLNGDYYHFFTGQQNSIGVVIADVVGKGVPAALCMSMIKYAIDSFPESMMFPKKILKSLNRVVERNIDDDMFITMLCATFDPDRLLFNYASAGHEPGFYYKAATDTFYDLRTKGLVLGVLPKTTYKEYCLRLQKGDAIILVTDGVTECRNNDQFLKREEITNLMKKYIHLPAPVMADHIFKQFQRIQNYQLDDDFTIIILKNV